MAAAASDARAGDGLLARLKQRRVLVGDGAWGTQLMQRGLPEGQPPEWFALERPEVIEEVARLYVAAGADLVTTDTFGGNSFRLALHGLDAEQKRINQQAVDAVRRAVAGRALVSASVGPSGRLLEPFGDVSPQALEAAFTEQIAVLAEAGADLVCVETMTDLTEAVSAVRAAKQVAPRPPGDGDDDLRAHAARLLHRDGYGRRGRRCRAGRRRRRRDRLELRQRNRRDGRDRPGDGGARDGAARVPAERRLARHPRRRARLPPDAGSDGGARPGAAGAGCRDRRRLLWHDARSRARAAPGGGRLPSSLEAS